MRANDLGGVGQRMEADGGSGGLPSVVPGALEGHCLVVGRESRGSLHTPVDVASSERMIRAPSRGTVDRV